MATLPDNAAGRNLFPHGFPEVTSEEFELFRELVQKETGIFLRDNKRTLLVSRLGRRLNALGVRTYTEYYRYLCERDPGREELRRLTNCITTNKTSFFREPHHFEFLREWLNRTVRHASGPGAERRIRIWSAACSTGEEPYSIAGTIAEALGTGLASWDVRILASDIDTDVLAQSRDGMYPAGDIDPVPAALRRRLFLRGTGAWRGFVQVRPEIKALVTFRRINLIDPIWRVQTSFDAIFCRNALIYFNRETQRTVITRLTGLLKADGFLFLGHSENLFWLTDLVTPLQHTVYRLRR